MEKRERNERNIYTYDEAGTIEVAQQILDSYNSGVVDVHVTEQQIQE